MARIVSLGSALQGLYVIDHDDFGSSNTGADSIFKDLHIGTKVDIDRINYEVGGGATNSATTFARHGHESIFIGNIGRDAAGDAVLACLDHEGIDSSYVTYVPRKSTGCSVILLDSISGERTILTHRGASAKFDNLNPADLRNINPDWLYVTSLRGDMDTLDAFFKEAKANDVKIMFNPGGLELAEPKKMTKLLQYVDVLLLNKREAKQLVLGDSLIELVSRLANLVNTVIITDGNVGGIATDHEKTYRFGIYEDLKVKDTTGAGDAFGSGFLAHLASGKSFRQSLIFASANSTSVVTKLGAKKGILTGSEELHPMPIQEITEEMLRNN